MNFRKPEQTARIKMYHTQISARENLQCSNKIMQVI